MIEKIRTTTYEVRSYRHRTVLAKDGTLMGTPALFTGSGGSSKWNKGYIKGLIRHLQDVLKCMKKIEKEMEKVK